jgi:hypothetical protein
MPMSYGRYEMNPGRARAMGKALLDRAGAYLTVENQGEGEPVRICLYDEDGHRDSQAEVPESSLPELFQEIFGNEVPDAEPEERWPEAVHRANEEGGNGAGAPHVHNNISLHVEAAKKIKKEA